MQKKWLSHVWLGVLVGCVVFTSASAETLRFSPPLSATASQPTELIDRIVAIVNSDVITQHELHERLAVVVGQMEKQGTPLPESKVLEKQILERMVMDMLLKQYAAETGLRIDDNQLDTAITRIALQNNFTTLSDFRTRLESEGVNFKQFREEIRSEIVTTRLREREVESRLVITESEVDNYLANQSRQERSGEEYRLAHILVLVPEQASATQVQQAKFRAEQALAQLAGGASFAQVAAATSDAADALKGGELGWKPVSRIPPLFLGALASLPVGQHTPILRSANGFHIVSLEEKRDGAGPVVVTQTHSRHILIKTSPTVSAEDAHKRMLAIKKELDGGAQFAELAKKYSEDGSAAKGGDLDWVSPGQFVPEFEAEMNRLPIGKVGLVQSQFGWHMIEVLERRSADVSEQQKRQQARMAIGSFKSDELYQDWLRQMRDRAFVEYRLDGQ